MRCPKCGFITFDHAASCSKCKTDLQGVGGGFQGTSVNVQPPSLLGSVTKQSAEPSVDDMLEEHGMSFDDAPADEESLDLMSDSDLDVADDLSDIDLNEFGALEVEDVADDESIPSLEPVSDLAGFADEEPLPQLDKISSDLSDIDISDLVASDDLDDDAIPSLEPLGGEPADELATLEPFGDDETEIPSLSPIEDVDAPAELSPLSGDDSFDDLDLASDDLDDDLSSMLENSELDDFDLGEEIVEDVALPTEPQTLDQSDGLETLEGGYDLSFDDDTDNDSGPLATAEGSAMDLSLELGDGLDDQTNKSPSSPVSPDIPDLGLTLESDLE